MVKEPIFGTFSLGGKFIGFLWPVGFLDDLVFKG